MNPTWRVAAYTSLCSAWTGLSDAGNHSRPRWYTGRHELIVRICTLFGVSVSEHPRYASTKKETATDRGGPVSPETYTTSPMPGIRDDVR
jgi:hypothetical protein